MKVLMVCLGNICRSPMAEGVLQHKAQQRGLKPEVDSAGTSGWHEGEPPDRRATAEMETRGIDISAQRSRPFANSDFDRFDHIFVMDSSNYADVMEMAKGEAQAQKVRMILNLSHPESNLSVPDPYFGGEQGFVTVYELLDKACEAFLDEIEN